VLKGLSSPRLAVSLLNAQIRIRGRARTPLSVRLVGRIRLAGSGHIEFGQGVTLLGNVVPVELICRKGARISIGDHTFINYGLSISAHKSINIGRHCLLGHYLSIQDTDESAVEQSEMERSSKTAVTIGDHVWIGAHVIILPGVSIGQHSAVGAGSVVTRDIPAYCLAVGNPARVVRRFGPEQVTAIKAAS
jgi:acetyltransferase-like isoleucine patch superfamily enzyme